MYTTRLTSLPSPLPRPSNPPHQLAHLTPIKLYTCSSNQQHKHTRKKENIVQFPLTQHNKKEETGKTNVKGSYVDRNQTMKKKVCLQNYQANNRSMRGNRKSCSISSLLQKKKIETGKVTRKRKLLSWKIENEKSIHIKLTNKQQKHAWKQKSSFNSL